jgi:DNA-binding response OmpR family regulator
MIEARQLVVSKLILIVEDEPDAAFLLQFHLRRYGYQTVAAADGVAGLTEAREHLPDLIIMDLMLPELHGLALCRLLRSSPRTRHIRIMVLTAAVADEERLACRQIGADEYVTKPFALPDLLARVEVLIGRGDRCEQPV